jgi:hypothetical protein
MSFLKERILVRIQLGVLNNLKEEKKYKRISREKIKIKKE